MVRNADNLLEEVYYLFTYSTRLLGVQVTTLYIGSSEFGSIYDIHVFPSIYTF